MVCPAASPPSGNQLSSSSLSSILSLERPRLKTPCLFVSLSSCIYTPSLTHLLRHATIRPRPVPCYSSQRLVTIHKIPCQFVSRLSRPLLSHLIASLVSSRLFEPVCSCVALAFYIAFMRARVLLRCVSIPIVLRIYCVSL
jgi:hypothetical protein